MKKPFLVVCAFLISALSFAQHTESIYLSGTGSDDTVLWDFFCTAGHKSGQWDKIPVPSNWEFHGFGSFSYGHDKERLNESGIYRHRFTVPQSWKGKKVNIVFEGSMTDTEVKVNGKSAGEIHQGAFYCFRYDISKLLSFGKENELEVTVHKASSNPTVEDAERIADFWVFGGIFRPVWLEALPEKHIERIAIDAKADGSFSMDVFLGKKLRKAELVAQVKSLYGTPYGAAISIAAGNQDSVRLSAEFSNPALWSSEFPNRYLVEVQLLDGGEQRHTLVEKFGFRTAELRPGDGFYVNGEKIKFKGVNRHTHWPASGRASNKTLSLNDALLIKEMNMNAVRMSHYPPDRHFLDVCDSLGLYVIDELTAWQDPPYDTKTGRKLVKELITRDVNHPCVVLWANGNEGGFNFELLPEYPRYDIQKRFVFHPWLEEEHVNTFHYFTFGHGVNTLFEGNRVFFPTEFMHGLYDGGHGAGLIDFWDKMLRNPLSAGAFLWDFADQAVLRHDKDNLLDTDGNHGADGIVGPYREKEGSFYAVREIWSPVYLEGTCFLPPSFDGKIKVHNRYHFTNLNQCTFEAEWIKHDYRQAAKSGRQTKVNAPDVKPGFAGILDVTLPEEGQAVYDVLRIRAVDPHGKEIYTWTRTITTAAEYAARLIDNAGEGNPASREENGNLILTAGNTAVTLDKSTGIIREIRTGNTVLPLANGPRFTDKDLRFSGIEEKEENGVSTIRLLYNAEKNRSARNYIELSLLPSGWLDLKYSFDKAGEYDVIGVTFDFPEDKVRKVRWLGNGPYRVWKNRMEGVGFDQWEKKFNNTVTGESWDYPEFKGFHSNIYAADLDTDFGTLKMVVASEDLYLHLFTPDKPARRNNDNTLGVFPDGQLSFLNAISPVGTKFHPAKSYGPQSQTNLFVSSSHAKPLTGHVYLKYEP